MTYEPFQPSNSDHGYAFMAAWCDHCEKDRRHRKDENKPGCKILLYTMAFNVGDPEYPKEWRKDGPEGARCTAFDPEHEPKPRRTAIRRRDNKAAIGDMFP